LDKTARYIQEPHNEQPTAIQAIEEQLVRDRQKLEELQEKEASLLENIPHQGFHTATNRANLHHEMEILEDAIRKNNMLLLMARK
jgi:hypothetical protein